MMQRGEYGLAIKDSLSKSISINPFDADAYATTEESLMQIQESMNAQLWTSIKLYPTQT